MKFFGIFDLGTVFAEYDAVRFIDSGNVGTVYGIDGAVGDKDISACVSKVNILSSLFFVCAAAFIYVVKDYGGRNGTSYVDAVEDKSYYGLGIFRSIFSKINRNLTE